MIITIWQSLVHTLSVMGHICCFYCFGPHRHHLGRHSVSMELLPRHRSSRTRFRRPRTLRHLRMDHRKEPISSPWSTDEPYCGSGAWTHLLPHGMHLLGVLFHAHLFPGLQARPSFSIGCLPLPHRASSTLTALLRTQIGGKTTFAEAIGLATGFYIAW